MYAPNRFHNILVVSEGSERLVNLLGLGREEGGTLRGKRLLALLPVLLASGEAFRFELAKDGLVLPADFVRQAADSRELTTGFEAKDAKGSGNDHTALMVVRLRTSFEDLQPLQGSGASRSLMRQHSSDGAPENAGWGTEVEGTTARVRRNLLAQEGVIL